MPTADYSSYHQPPGTGGDGTKLDNFIDAVQATVNALDNNNIAAAAGILLSKLAQGGATTKQFVQWDGSQWSPAGGYTAYTPTWTSTGTLPALGNGTITGRYLQIGKLVQGTVSLAMGSTTTFGTGVYIFSLPVTAGAALTVNFPVGSAIVVDASPSNVYTLTPALVTGGASIVLESAASPGVSAGTTAPITFASGDQIIVNFTYEAA